MDKKEFKQATAKVYADYGFCKKGKCFYLDLEDVLICSGINYRNGVTYLAYTFSVKGAHTPDEYKPNNMFDGFDSWEIPIYFERNEKRCLEQEICIEKYTIEEYSEKLRKVLHEYFDPYRENAIDYIKRCDREVGLVIHDDIVSVHYVAKQYLNI